MHDIFFDLEQLRKNADEDEDNEYWIYFFGQQIKKSDLVEKEKHKGCICISCNEFCQFSEPNQEDGTFKCYSCRE
jgi:hypothetical protein